MNNFHVLMLGITTLIVLGVASHAVAAPWAGRRRFDGLQSIRNDDRTHYLRSEPPPGGEDKRLRRGLETADRVALCRPVFFNALATNQPADRRGRARLNGA